MQRVNALAQDNTFGAASRISASVRACSRPGSARQRGRHAVGEEIAIRARTLVHDAANPTEVMRDVVAFATAGLRLRQRRRSPGQRVVAPVTRSPPAARG